MNTSNFTFRSIIAMNTPSSQPMLKMVLFCLVVLFLVVTESVSEKRGNCGNAWCTCNPVHKLATCKDHGRSLSYIPELPKYVTKLDFSSNYLPNVSKRTFANITSLRLLEMNLTYSSIQQIAPDAFTVLTNLKTLSLNGNRFSSEILTGMLRTLSKLSLSLLSLEKINLTTTVSFRHSISHSLKTLILDHNRITIYNHSDFENLHSLETLSLGHNHIQPVFLSYASSLQNLVLMDNLIPTLPGFCDGQEASTFFPNLVKLKLDHNSMLFIDPARIKCLKNLETFSMNTNRILKIQQNTFSELPSLTTLILRNLHGNLHIERYAFNNSEIRYISLTSGGIHFKTAVHKDAFRGCSNIKSLDVSFNVFHDASQDDLDDWFGHLTSLTGFGLGNCNIKHYPLFIPIKLKSLEYLKLYGNVITEIPVGAFQPLYNLSHLWLTNNKIAKLEEMAFPQGVRERIKVISLMYNPFACDCDILWFLNWTKSEPQKFQHYPEKYICDSPGKMRKKPLSKVHFAENECLLPLWIAQVVISSICVFLVFLLMISLTYKWRWHIRYYMYQRKKKRGDFKQISDEDIVYDAYVIYSYEDLKWLKKELIPNLEEESGQKLYIRDRDSLPGDPIVDNVVNNMTISRCVLVVLSDAMARDEECQFELMLVQRQEEGQTLPIVLVLLEEVHAANVTQSVYALVKMNSYICWGAEQEARELFWNRLLQSLRE